MKFQPDNTVVFATSGYQYFADEFQSKLYHNWFPRVDLEAKNFPDNERYRRFIFPESVTDLEGMDAIIIGGTCDDQNTQELIALGYAAQSYGARSITFIIPYFAYSTQERPVEQGEFNMAKIMASQLSAIPKAPFGNTFMVFDMHSEGTPFYFENGVRVKHVYCESVALANIREAAAGRKYKLGATDAGRHKWIASFAAKLGVDALFIDKKRISGSEVKVMHVDASQFEGGEAVVIYDDMGRSGNSAIEAARAYRKAGASSVSLVVTHGIFPKGAIERIQKSGHIDWVFCTNSHPQALALLKTHAYLRVSSVVDIAINNL